MDLDCFELTHYELTIQLSHPHCIESIQDELTMQLTMNLSSDESTLRQINSIIRGPFSE
jgi:hypothetical protein